MLTLEEKLKQEKQIHIELQNRIDDLEWENQELRTLLNLTLREILLNKWRKENNLKGENK